MDSIADLSEPVKVQVRARPADYKAGKAIADADGVVMDEFTPIKVRATVTEPGHQTRRTQLTAGPDGFDWACTCNGQKLFCRHVVATALATWAKAPKRQP